LNLTSSLVSWSPLSRGKKTRKTYLIMKLDVVSVNGGSSDMDMYNFSGRVLVDRIIWISRKLQSSSDKSFADILPPMCQGHKT
jgi:hypothetical protein